jgi:hypothetical protein
VRILDLNVLLYATNESSVHHDTARPFLERVLTDGRTVGLPWAVVVGYLRLTTSPHVLAEPRTADESGAVVRGWLDRPEVLTPAPTSRHLDTVLELIAATGAGGNLVSDAHLGALAVEHGAELWSYDHDFARFPGVIWRSPAIDQPA